MVILSVLNINSADSTTIPLGMMKPGWKKVHKCSTLTKRRLFHLLTKCAKTFSMLGVETIESCLLGYVLHPQSYKIFVKKQMIKNIKCLKTLHSITSSMFQKRPTLRNHHDSE